MRGMREGMGEREGSEGGVYVRQVRKGRGGE